MADKVKVNHVVVPSPKDVVEDVRVKENPTEGSEMGVEVPIPDSTGGGLVNWEKQLGAV